MYVFTLQLWNTLRFPVHNSWKIKFHFSFKGKVQHLYLIRNVHFIPQVSQEIIHNKMNLWKFYHNSFSHFREKNCILVGFTNSCRMITFRKFDKTVPLIWLTCLPLHWRMYEALYTQCFPSVCGKKNPLERDSNPKQFLLVNPCCLIDSCISARNFPSMVLWN